jgi:hypothetical protein
VYSTFGSWYGDDTPLNQVQGDLKYFKRGPNEGKYEMSVQLPDQREVKVEVTDDSTVADVKKQVAQVTRSYGTRRNRGGANRGNDLQLLSNDAD